MSQKMFRCLRHLRWNVAHSENCREFLGAIPVHRLTVTSISLRHNAKLEVRKTLLPLCSSVGCTGSVRFYSKKTAEPAKNVINFHEFKEAEKKNKTTFHRMIDLYDERFKKRTGVVEFIYAAVQSLKEYQLEEDLETYKKIIDLMPKGKYVPQNKYQLAFRHYPREQDCIKEVLDIMTENGVHVDVELCEILTKIFGEKGEPTVKCMLSLYWSSKLKNLTPFPLPKPLPDSTFELATLAVKRISGVDPRAKITVFRTEDVEASIDKTWIVSAQSREQMALLERHDRTQPIIVEGGDYVWLRKKRISYFVLKSGNVKIDYEIPNEDEKFNFDNFETTFFNPNYEEKRQPSVHEQEDGIIYAVCATGTSQKDSLLSWVRLLEMNGNPVLGELAILFRFKSGEQTPVPMSKDLSRAENT